MPRRAPVTDWTAIRIAVVSRALTMEEAAAKLNIPLGTIKARSSREGWFKSVSSPDGRGVKKHDPKAAEIQESEVQRQKELDKEKSLALAAHSKEVATVVAESLSEHREQGRLISARVTRKGLEHAESLPGAAILKESQKIKNLIDGNAKATGYDTDSGNSLVVSLNFLDDGDPAKVVDI